MIGNRLGPYEITAKLGEGGMGEVYRAHDTKLKRDVAIKVLPAAFTQDKERLARFEREAQLLAQLHHPNIASIFGLEESDGTRALVMELVEGPTLAERLEQGPLPFNESLSVSLQIAHALEEAHEKGIVHRDLKPQNVKASIEGKVKVLDFGLAKAMDPAAGSAASAADLARSPTLMQSPTLTAAHGTQLGVILGTAAYMAPEQARGMTVDRRADIWAFGVVLYEMLVGRSLFAGDTVTDTLAGVLKTEIDFSKLPAETPFSIRRLLRRCLERNPKNRLHDIADARIVIDDVIAGRSDDSAAATLPAAAELAPASRRGRLRWLAAGAALGAVVSLAIAGAWRGRTSAPAANEPLMSVRALVSGGAPFSPAITRDGRTLAFVAARNGEVRVWIKDLASGSESALARDRSFNPAFSPDGTSLLFTARQADGTGLFRIALATREERLVAREAGPGSWSPDGRRVAFVRTEAEKNRKFRAQELVVVELGSGEERAVGQYEMRERALDSAPRWSPDGGRLAIHANAGMAGVSWKIAVFDVGSGQLEEYEPRVAGLEGIELTGLDWISNDRLMLLLNDGPGGTTSSGRLASFDLAAGRTTSLLPLQPIVGGVALADGGAVVVALGSTDTNLFESRRSAAGAWSELARLTDGPYLDRQPVDTPDGSAIVFVSNRNGNYDLWRLTRATRELRRLTDSDAVDWDPALSPDGSRLAFSSDRSGRFEIWVADADGNAPRQVTDFENAQNPTWTGDGSWLVFSRNGSPDANGFWRIRPDGSEPSRVSEFSGIGEASPDGPYAAGSEMGHSKIVRLDDGTMTTITDFIARQRWSLERGAMFLWGLGREGVRRIPFDAASATVGKAETVVPRPAGIDFGTLGVARDGSTVVVSYETFRSQIVRIDGLAALEKR